MLRNLLFLPSHLCLDAPLVATVWVVVLRDLSTQESLPWAAVAGLGFCIWAVYLFDRLFDVRSQGISEETPGRHRFTARHPKLFLVLLSVALFGCIVCLPGVPARILAGAGVLGVVTMAYYGAFRFFRTSESLLAKAPWKELTIAISFVAGIFLCLWPIKSITLAVATGLTLLLLFLANCLKIALAESSRDRDHDKAGFYSDSTRGASTTLLTLPLIAFVSSLGILFHDPGTGLALSLTSLACFLINRSRKLPSPFVQAVSDIALLLPPALLLAGQYLLSR